MSDEALTFSELRKIQKQEKRQESLTELDDNFLLNVADYFSRKKEMSGEDREYRNAKRVFNKIISLREDKIVKNAKIAAKSDANVSTSQLLPMEQELYRELKTSFKEHRERAEERAEDQSKVEVEYEDEMDDEPEEEPGEEQEEEDGDYENVKIKAKVPEFMGTDLETYGPFEEGEEVKVPEDNAEILINRGNAEKIES